MLGSIKMKLAITLYVIGIICATFIGITFAWRHTGPSFWPFIAIGSLVAFVCAAILFALANRARTKVAMKKPLWKRLPFWILISINILVFGIYIVLLILRDAESEGSGLYDALSMIIILATFVIFGLIIIDVIVGLIWTSRARRK